MTPKDVIKLAKDKGAKIVDLRFIDVPGLWQHFSIPVSELTEELFAEGSCRIRPPRRWTRSPRSRPWS
jgi:glutamine synthetase